MGKFSKPWRRTITNIRKFPRRLSSKWRRRGNENSFYIVESRGDARGQGPSAPP